MVNQGLNIAPPPRKTNPQGKPEPKAPSPEASHKATNRSQRTSVTFDRLAEGDKVQFNKRVTQSTADGFQMLSIKTRKKIPDLLAEGLELLEAKYGKV